MLSPSLPILVVCRIYVWILMSSLIIIIIVDNLVHANLVLSGTGRQSLVGVNCVILLHVVVVLGCGHIHSASFGQVSTRVKMASLHIFRSLRVTIH